MEEVIILIPYDELTDFDFQILLAVYEHQPVTLEDLAGILPGHHALNLRVEMLSRCDMMVLSRGPALPRPGTSYLESDGESITITEHGIKAVEDWRLQCLKDSRALWEGRFWKLGPIIISILALAVATISLLQALKWIDIAK